MGLFLQAAILKGSSLADFTRVLPEVSAEHPQMNLDGASGHYHTYDDGTGILFSDGVVGYEPLAKTLSEKLGRSVLLLYIYDGDQWGYYLYENGNRLDGFSPVPDYFTGDESEVEALKGSAKVIARHFGVAVGAVERYLLRWTDEQMTSGEKAYPSDQFTYGDCWQMADFMNALGHPYAFAEEAEAVDGEAVPAAVFDTALVSNDLERWIADTYVIWSGRGGGSWQLFGGFPKTEENTEILKEQLARDWKIHNLTEGINTVNYLVEDERHKTPATDGWDFGRGMQLLGVFYLIGYINRATMVEYSCIIGKIIQRHFDSWEAFCESYLAGHAQWCRKTFPKAEAEADIAERRTLYEKFKKMKDGPYRLPWKLSLRPESHRTGGDHFAKWLAQEEQWATAFRRKTGRMVLLCGLVTTLFMAAFLVGVGQVSGGGNLLVSAILGAAVGVAVMLPVYLMVMAGLGRGRISQAVKDAAERLGMDEEERQVLGMKMLSVLQMHGGHLDYTEKTAPFQTTPARVVLDGDYFYQASGRMQVNMIRRSDVEYIESGQHRGQVGGRSVNLYGIYFFYRASRERRLEGDSSTDAVMSFFDRSIRDRVYATINRQMKLH